MSGFRPGEIVDITIKGVRVVSHPSASLVRIADEHGATFDMPAQAAIERLTPEHWPPMTGDIWEDGDGRQWFVQNRHGDLRLIPLYVELNEDVLMADLPDHFRDYSGPVRLVYREEPPF